MPPYTARVLTNQDVAAIYAFIVSACVYREIGWADIPRILGEVAEVAGQ